MSNTVNNYTETDLGNVSLNPRGEYDSSVEYEYLDAVSYQGGSYFCLAELETTITGIAPDAGRNSEHWQLIATPGDMTPEYTAAYNNVINKAVQVEASRAAVELAQQEIEAVQTDVQQLHSDTVQTAQQAENSKNSAANSAQSAEQSRKTVSESEQNINGQIAGFDSRVSEAVEQSKEEINTTKQQAINTITNQQTTSVNTVKTEGEKIITKVGNDAKTVADDRATVEEATQTVLNNAREVAQNTQTVASNTEKAAASAEGARTSADNAAQSAKSVEDASKQIEQNKKDVDSLKEDLYVKTYNIFDVNFLPRAFIPLTSSHAGELFLDNNDNYSATNETINVLTNTQYTFSNGSESIPYELQLSVIFYDKDMRFIGYVSNTINNSSKYFKFTTIENTNHLRFQLRSTGKGSDIPNIKKWQLNEGNPLPYLDNYVLNCSTDNIGNELTNINIDNPQVRDFVEDVDYTNQEYTITQVGTYSAPSVYYRKDCGFPMVVKWKLNRDIKNQILYISTNKLIPIADTVTVKSYDIPCGINNFAVYNLIPNATYYYKVCGTDFDNNLIVIKEGCFTTIGQVHMLKIDGLKNVRDLGGWLTPNGKIKYGLLFRGCELDDTGGGVELTHEGKKELFDRIRIKTDIDLRTDVGNTKSPIGALVDYNCYPIQPYDTGLKDTITKGLIKSIFEKIEEKLSKSNAIYFHCQGGRDRTGTLAFLILGVLGVSESDIAKDYELTEFAYASYKADNPNTSRKFAQYVSMVSYIKTFNGVTFNDKIISYLLSIGISQATINNIKSYMVA